MKINDWDCGDGQCINPNWVCDGSSEFCNATWGPDCSNGADEGLESGRHADECGSGFTCTDGSTVDLSRRLYILCIRLDCIRCKLVLMLHGMLLDNTCAQLESVVRDCTGCTYPGDSTEPDPCVEAGGNLGWLGDGYCDSGIMLVDVVMIMVTAAGDCTDGTYSCDSFGGDCNDCINPDSVVTMVVSVILHIAKINSMLSRAAGDCTASQMQDITVGVTMLVVIMVRRYCNIGYYLSYVLVMDGVME